MGVASERSSDPERGPGLGGELAEALVPGLDEEREKALEQAKEREKEAKWVTWCAFPW